MTFPQNVVVAQAILLIGIISRCASTDAETVSARQLSPTRNATVPVDTDKTTGVIDDNTIQINSDGVPAENSKKFEADLKQLFINIGTWAEAQPKCKRIVLFIHGGMVTLNEAKKTAKDLTDKIKNDPTAYPLFINWEAGPLTSYFRHLAYERNGVSYRGTPSAALSVAGSPLILLADLGRGISRLPINTILSTGKLLQNSDTLSGNSGRLFPVKGKLEDTLSLNFNGGVKKHFLQDGLTYKADGHRGRNINVVLGRDCRGKLDVGLIGKSVLTIPLQFTTEPVLDALGTPAWGNMLRRTRSMFHSGTNYITQSNLKDELQTGAAAVFFRELNECMESHEDLHLDVIAHSMGTIVMNEAFVQVPNLRVRNLVYMAAACSIRDFQASAGWHINNSCTEFYNLSLHPRAELDDAEFMGIPMKGSLLVWIDEFFQSPESFEDRTLGTFENAVIAKDYLPDNPRVHLKAFPLSNHRCHPGDKCLGPQTHPDFTTYAFWWPSFWSTDYPGTEEPTYSKVRK